MRFALEHQRDQPVVALAIEEVLVDARIGDEGEALLGARDAAIGGGGAEGAAVSGPVGSAGSLREVGDKGGRLRIAAHEEEEEAASGWPAKALGDEARACGARRRREEQSPSQRLPPRGLRR